MPRMTGKVSERQRNAFAKLRLLGSFALSFVLILGVYYFFYVEKKSSYLVSRNFRFLATMGEQVKGSLSSQNKVLENLTKKNEFVQVLKLDPAADLDPKSRQKRRDILESFAPLFEEVHADPDKNDPASKQPAAPDSQPYELKLKNSDYVLDFSSPLPPAADKHLHG